MTNAEQSETARRWLRPGARLLWSVLAIVALALITELSGAASAWWQWPAVLLAGLTLVDLWQVSRTPWPVVVRRMPHNLPVNRLTDIRLQLRNRSKLPQWLQVDESIPGDWAVDGLPGSALLPPESGAVLKFEVRPLQRGASTLPPTTLLRRSPFGFWQQRRPADMPPQPVQVYPDFAIIREYLELLPAQQTGVLGIRRMPRLGEGLEFHQLRDYRPGDSSRQVDWKATSRRLTLISREYEDERDQQLVFLLDTGRRMRSREQGLSHFDHTLNATLLLSYIALRQGDRIAALSFGAESTWIPPMRGPAALRQLLAATYAMQPGSEASDYVQAAEALMQRQRKRALVLLLTNIREDDADLIPALRLLRSRHLVILASLREQALDDCLQQQPGDFGSALELAGAHYYLNARRQLTKALVTESDALIDTTPKALPVSLVNSYWAMKRSRRL